jgi:hypothetical protein
MNWHQVHFGMRICIHTKNLVGKCLSDCFNIPKIKHDRLETIDSREKTLRLRSRYQALDAHSSQPHWDHRLVEGVLIRFGVFVEYVFKDSLSVVAMPDGYQTWDSASE